MIVVRLLGGLGNQMFQYALGRRLALERGVPLALDLSAFASYPLRTYRLDRFQIAARVASPGEVARIQGPELWRKVRRSLERRLLPYYRWSIVRERAPFVFDPNILRAPRNVYLQGYWQNEGYFNSIADRLRLEFRMRGGLGDEAWAMAGQIASVTAVSVHVRRGDYATNPVVRAEHGLLPLAYYTRAAATLAAEVPAPHFFVFSDDPDWAEANLQLEYPTTVVRNAGPDRDQEDLILLSKCRHHIIANSSFSWWGAWLCSHPDKRIIAPARWKHAPEVRGRDVVPPEWQVMAL